MAVRCWIKNEVWHEYNEQYKSDMYIIDSGVNVRNTIKNTVNAWGKRNKALQRVPCP